MSPKRFQVAYCTPLQRGHRRSHGRSGTRRHDDAGGRKVEELFDVLRIDHRNDHNTRDTPMRVAKMFVEETLRGPLYGAAQDHRVRQRPGYDQLIVTGPIELRSICAHHLMPIYGHAYIGVLPSADGKIIGSVQV